MKQLLKDILLIMAAVVLLILALASCAAPQPIIMPQTEKIYQNDSTVIIYRDSIVERKRNDTIYIEKYYNNTIYKTVKDSTSNETPVQVEVPVKVVPQWCWWLLLADVIVVFIFILYVVFRIAKAIYLKR